MDYQLVHPDEKLIKCDGCGKEFHANEIQTIDFCYGSMNLCMDCEEAERKRRYLAEWNENRDL